MTEWYALVDRLTDVVCILAALTLWLVLLKRW